MEILKDFLRKENQVITILLTNLLLTCLLLVILSILKIINISELISPEKISLGLIFISSLIFIFRYEASDKKDNYRKALKIGFMIIFGFSALCMNSLQLTSTLFPSIKFIASLYNNYTIILLLFVSILLLWVYRKSRKNEKTKVVFNNNISYFLLIVILMGFTAIKAPYFNYGFSGEHAMKYNTYVEPAKYMAEKYDFTWYQQKYLSDPVTNPYGISKKLPQLPLLEWSLASSFILLPNNSIEFNTRIVTHIIGLFTLIFAFILTKRWSNNFFALIITGLMAVNPIIIFATYVTVYDGITFMLLLLSLYFLSKSFENENSYRFLVLSGLVAGLGMSVKISFLIWLLPTSIFFIWSRKKDNLKKILDSTIFFLNTILVYLTTKLSIPCLAENSNKAIFFLLLGFLLIIVFFFLIKKYKICIISYLNIFNEKKILIPVITILVLVFIPIAYNFITYDNLITTYLTDKRLLFNFEIYEYLIYKQFLPNLTINVFLFSFIGFFSLLLIKKKLLKIFIITFLLSSLFFSIIASKSIFPHSYYMEIIMFSLLLLASLTVYTFINILRNPYIVILFLLFSTIFLLPQTITRSTTIISRTISEYEEIVKYLNLNTNPGDYFLDNAYIPTVLFDTDLYRSTDLQSLSRYESFKRDIQKLGFKNTLDKYKIKYLVTMDTLPDYKSYVPLFIQKNLDSSKYDRGRILLNIVDPVHFDLYPDESRREELVTELHIPEKFVFEEKIGRYNFFTFAD